MLKKIYNKKKGEQTIIGFVEVVTPAFISGWVFSEKIIEKVVLKSGKNIISSTNNFSYREDVSKKLNKKGKFGFKLKIDSFDSKINLKENPPKIIAQLKDNKHSEQINPAVKINGKNITKKSFSSYLENFLNNQYSGFSGYVEGLQVDGKIHGWISSPKFSKKVFIWISCGISESIPVLCDKQRNIIEESSDLEYRGFEIDPQDLPISWSLKYVKISFDEKAILNIHYDKRCKLPKITKKNPVIVNSESILPNHHSQNCSFKNLNQEQIKQWQEVYEFENFLNEVNEEVNYL